MRSFVVLLALSCGLWACDSGLETDFNPGPTGTGGSTARFTVVGDFLYVVNNTSLKVVDVTNERRPVYKSSIDIGWGVETIFGYNEHLFIGSQTGMYVYAINNEGIPEYQSYFVHQTACDPVIANDRYAYVTVRSGESCNNQLFEANQLITIDVSDLSNPQETDLQQMISPRGLAFFKGCLFVGEGDNGLKKFSLADPAHPQLITYYEGIATNDMIGLEETLIITRNEGIFQFGCDEGCEEDELELFSPIQ